MSSIALALISATCLVLGSTALATAPAAKPTTSPTDNGWDAKWFDYQRPSALVYEQTTPTREQVDFHFRPPQVRPDESDPKPATKAPKPLTVENLNIVHLRFRDPQGEVVPVLLCTPRDRKGPFPVVIAVHGLTSHKGQVCAQVAPALARRGFAVLAPDMPRHGERRGDPRSVMDRSNLVKTFELFRQAVTDVRWCIDIAEHHPDLDARDGVTLAGYSMGSWISSITGAADGRVKAMVLMVGGANDTPPAALLIPPVAATDPRLALAHFAGRPLLMLNGKSDPVVTPDMAQRLYAAAPEPKKQVWYDTGHLLSTEAYNDAAKWIANTAKQRAASARPPGEAMLPQRKAG